MPSKQGGKYYDDQGNVIFVGDEWDLLARVVELEAEVARLRRERMYWYRVAEWFCENAPGEDWPEWIMVGLRSGEPVVDEEELVASEQAAEAAGGE